MSAAGHVWRVTGTWPDESTLEDDEHIPAIRVRHYLSVSGARRRAKAWMSGREDWGREPETGAPEVYIVAPAISVQIERSDQITWTSAEEESA